MAESLICKIKNVVPEQVSKKKRTPFTAIQAVAFGCVAHTVSGTVENIVPVTNQEVNGRLVNLTEIGFKGFMKYYQVFIPDGYPIQVKPGHIIELVAYPELYCLPTSPRVEIRYICAENQDATTIYDETKDLIKLSIEDYSCLKTWEPGFDVVEVSPQPYRNSQTGFLGIKYLSARIGEHQEERIAA